MATHDFLKDYQNVLLRHVIMPGSHDAGLANASYSKLGMIPGGRSKTVTQSVGVGQQAAWGSRFFDVRIIKSGGHLKAYHSPGDTRAGGGVGQTFETILNELRDFVAANTTEFVIIRLAHLKDSDEVFDCLIEWMEKPYRGGVNGDVVCVEGGNLASKKVGRLAGRMILLVESKKLKPKKFAKYVAVPAQIHGFHKLYQNKAGKPLPSVTDGLCICGEFSKSNDLETIVAKQTTNYSIHDEHKTHEEHKSHLYCLYWTATKGNIKENTKELQQSSNFKRVREMVKARSESNAKRLQDKHIPLVHTKDWSNAIDTENLARKKYSVFSCSLPNIILYDFVNAHTSRQIICLNRLVWAKGW